MVETSVSMAGPAGQSDHNGNGHRFEKAANNWLLMLWARWSMVIAIPLISALGGVGMWIGAEVWKSFKTEQAETREAIRGAERAVNDLRNMFTTLTGGQTLLNSRIDAHADRLKGIDERNSQQDQRMDRYDQKLDGLQQRFWQTPTAIRQPEEQQRQQWQQK